MIVRPTDGISTAIGAPVSARASSDCGSVAVTRSARGVEYRHERPARRGEVTDFRIGTRDDAIVRRDDCREAFRSGRCARIRHRSRGLRLCGGVLGCGLVERRLADELALGELPAALVFGLRIDEVRLRLAKLTLARRFGLRRAPRVDLDQQLPRFHRIAGTHRDRDDAPVHLGGDRRLAHRFDDRFHPRGAMALDVRGDCGLSGCGVRCSREREHKPAPNGRCPCVPMPMRFHLLAPSRIDSPELERLVAARL